MGLCTCVCLPVSLLAPLQSVHLIAASGIDRVSPLFKTFQWLPLHRGQRPTSLSWLRDLTWGAPARAPAPSPATHPAHPQGPATLAFCCVFEHTLPLPVLGSLHLLLSLPNTFFPPPFAPSEPNAISHTAFLGPLYVPLYHPVHLLCIMCHHFNYIIICVVSYLMPVFLIPLQVPRQQGQCIFFRYGFQEHCVV